MTTRACRLLSLYGLAALSTAAIAAPASLEGQRLAVLELRSGKLDKAKAAEVDASLLTDEVRSAAFRAMPHIRVMTKGDLKVILDSLGKTLEQCEGECAVETGRNVSADLVVDGEVLWRGGSFVLRMELHETKLGGLIGAASAKARTGVELDEAIPAAVDTLFERVKGRTSDKSRVNLVEKQTLGEVPELSGALKGGDAINLDIDPDLAQLYDAAIKSDRTAKEHPTQTADAWQKLADAKPATGGNPYQDEAARRAKQWRDYFAEQKKLAEQRDRDRIKLQKLLPLEVVNDGLKEDLLLRYARLYGGDELPALLALIPSDRSREQAQSAVDCELGKSAVSCGLAAVAHEQARDMIGAARFHERGCNLGAVTSCERLGQMLLNGEGMPADPARAQLALNEACNKRSASACKTLGQIHARGDLGKPDAQKVMDLYGKACDLKDGEACALAGDLAAQARPDDPAAGLSWRRDACTYGYQAACQMVRDYENKLDADRREQQRIADAKRAEEKRLADEAEAERLRIETERQRRLAIAMEAYNANEERRHWGYGVAAAGVLAGAGSGFFLMKGASNNDAVKSNTAKTGAALQSMIDQGKTYNTLAMVFGATAVVDLAVGVPLILFNRPTEEPKLSLAVAPNGMLLTLRLP